MLLRVRLIKFFAALTPPLFFGLTLIAIASLTSEAFAQVPGASLKLTPTMNSGLSASHDTGAPADAKLSPPIWSNTDTQFFKQYPYLDHNVYHEPDSHFMFGFSAGILGLVENRLLFSGNFFQVHYQTQQLDWEMLNIAYGMSTANPSNIKSNHFIFRTAPKYRMTRKMAVGPLLGYEFVNFPTVTAVLYKDRAGETQPEPFSSAGMIYGVEVTETFPLDNGWQLRLSQVGYQETYSTSDAGKGWSYLYADSALRKDPGPLKAGTVIELEIGLLF